MGDERSSIWTSHFTTGTVADLDAGLAAVLRLQAERADSDMQKLKDEADDMETKDRVKMESRVDRNLDRVFRNAMLLRATKVTPNGRSRISSERVELPEAPTPPMLAQAFEMMQEEAEERGEVFDRASVCEADIWDFLAARGLVQPRSQQKALEF